jgi:hypothetical protein
LCAASDELSRFEWAGSVTTAIDGHRSRAQLFRVGSAQTLALGDSSEFQRIGEEFKRYVIELGGLEPLGHGSGEIGRAHV